jgi:diguanylate cyclase (GGDEF)-like protein
LIDNTLINSEASKDPLTGALNRQKLNQLYFNQLEIAFATSETFVLAMCDLDNFKKVNDTYGHVAGDEVLKNFVKISKKILRSSDMLIRYGGEEFMFILPAIRLDKAKIILNEIKDEFASFVLDFEGNKISTTLSFGTLELNPEAEESYLKNFESVVSFVDKKLYEAKNSGKNRVC